MKVCFMRIINSKKIILLVVLVFALGIIFGFCFIKKDFEYQTTILKNNPNILAFFIEQEDGTYVKKEDINFPTQADGYIFNSSKSICYNQDGDIIINSLSFENNKLKIKTTEATYCYLYFDILN